MKTERQAIAMIFCNPATNEVCLQKRPEGKSLAGHWLIPGGKWEKEDRDWEAVLRRESLEEFGVVPVVYTLLTPNPPIVGETGRRLYPYLITEWAGEFPQVVLDRGDPVKWVQLESLFENPLESTQKLARVTIEKLKKLIT